MYSTRNNSQVLQSINFDIHASEFENVGRRRKTKFRLFEIRRSPPKSGATSTKANGLDPIGR